MSTCIVCRHERGHAPRCPMRNPPNPWRRHVSTLGILLRYRLTGRY